MESERVTGGCLCGSIRYECEGPIDDVSFCHCESCRRSVGAHSVAWMTVPNDRFRLTASEPQRHASSPDVVRTFCGRCGTSLTYARAESASTDVTVTSLDQPAAVVPTHHIWMADAIPWDRPGDGLPRFRTTRGAGERLDD